MDTGLAGVTDFDCDIRRTPAGRSRSMAPTPKEPGAPALAYKLRANHEAALTVAAPPRAVKRIAEAVSAPGLGLIWADQGAEAARRCRSQIVLELLVNKPTADQVIFNPAARPIRCRKRPQTLVMDGSHDHLGL